MAEHVDLGHAETDFFAPSTCVLQVDPQQVPYLVEWATRRPIPGMCLGRTSRRPSSRHHQCKRSRPTSARGRDDEVPLERTPLFEPAVATEMELPEMRPTRRPTVVAAPVQPVQARPHCGRSGNRRSASSTRRRRRRLLRSKPVVDYFLRAGVLIITVLHQFTAGGPGPARRRRRRPSAARAPRRW